MPPKSTYRKVKAELKRRMRRLADGLPVDPEHKRVIEKNLRKGNITKSKLNELMEEFLYGTEEA